MKRYEQIIRAWQIILGSLEDTGLHYLLANEITIIDETLKKYGEEK